MFSSEQLVQLRQDVKCIYDASGAFGEEEKNGSGEEQGLPAFIFASSSALTFPKKQTFNLGKAGKTVPAAPLITVTTSARNCY